MTENNENKPRKRRRKNRRPPKHVRDKLRARLDAATAPIDVTAAVAEANDISDEQVLAKPKEVLPDGARIVPSKLEIALAEATVEQLEDALIAKVPALKKQYDLTPTDKLVYGLIKGRHYDLLKWAAQAGQMTPQEAIRIYMTRNLVDAKKHRAHAEGRTGGTTLELRE